MVRLSKRMRFLFVVSMLVAVPLVAAPAAPAKKRTKCQRLAAVEKDLSTAKTWVIVARQNGQGDDDLLGCRLPNGKVYTFANGFDDGVSSEKVSVGKVVGPWALFDIDEDSTAGSGRQTSLANAATGRVFSLGGTSCPPPLSGSPCTSGGLLRIQFSAKGRVVTAQSANAGLQIIGYSALAQATLLDQGSSSAVPVADVRFKGETAHWTHSGQSLSAALSERPCKLPGNDLAPAKDVVLVRRAAKDEAGEPGSELVGCARPAGPPRVLGTAGTFLETAPSRDGQIGRGERTLDVRSVAGSWVSVAGRAISSSGEGNEARVVDLRSGRSYTVFSNTCLPGACQGAPTLSAVLLNGRGQAATALELQGQTALTAFTSTGARRPLDNGPSSELPPGSLRLTGSTASWTRNGEAKSFDIAEG